MTRDHAVGEVESRKRSLYWSIRSSRFLQPLKRHPFVYEGYVRWLKWRCRRVEAFVFVASTGRSGTNTLADLFEGIPDCVALHEPRPPMVTPGAARLDPGRYFDDVFRASKRVEMLRTARTSRLYLETTHQFIKNFAPQAVELFGDKLRVVHLRRDPVSVASSFYAIGSVPGRTEKGITWLIDPGRVDNCLPIADLLDKDASFGHDYYRCLWYWYETEARVRRFGRQFPQVPLAHVRTDELNDPQAIERLLAEIGLERYSTAVTARAGLRANQKTDKKRRELPVDDAEEMRVRLEAELVGRFGGEVPLYP